MSGLWIFCCSFILGKLCRQLVDVSHFLSDNKVSFSKVYMQTLGILQNCSSYDSWRLNLVKKFWLYILQSYMNCFCPLLYIFFLLLYTKQRHNDNWGNCAAKAINLITAEVFALVGMSCCKTLCKQILINKYLFKIYMYIPTPSHQLNF